MANLSVRKLDDDLVRQLRIQAATHGVSMEEEVRRILQRSVATPQHLGDLAVQLFGPAHGVSLQLPPRSVHAPVDFRER